MGQILGCRFRPLQTRCRIALHDANRRLAFRLLPDRTAIDWAVTPNSLRVLSDHQDIVLTAGCLIASCGLLPTTVHHGKAPLTTQTPAPAYGGRVDHGVLGDDGTSQPDDGPGQVLSRRISANGNGKSRRAAAFSIGCDGWARQKTGAGAMA